MTIILEKIGYIFLLLAVGYIIGKLNWIPQKVTKMCNSILINVTCPCLIMSSITSKEVVDSTLSSTIIVFSGGLIFLLLSAMLGHLISRHILSFKPNNDCGVLAFAFGSVNSGFMGFPVTLALFGKDIFYLMVMHNVALTIYMYSIGPSLLHALHDQNPHEKEYTISSALKLKRVLKSLLNPNTVSSIISIFMLFAGLHLPEIPFTAITLIGKTSIPLSMLVIGLKLSEGKILKLLKNYKLLIFSFIKMAILPFFTFLAVNWLPLSVNIKLCMVFAATFPVAVAIVPITLSEKRNSLIAAEMVTVTTLISIFTIPVFASILATIYL